MIVIDVFVSLYQYQYGVIGFVDFGIIYGFIWRIINVSVMVIRVDIVFGMMMIVI